MMRCAGRLAAIAAFAFVLTVSGPAHAWFIWIMERGEVPHTALNDNLKLGALQGADDGFDTFDAAEVTTPSYYVSVASLILESPSWLSVDMRAPMPVGVEQTEVWDVPVRTDVMEEVTFGFSWDPNDASYGYDFSDLEAEGLSLSKLVLVDEGTSDGGFVAEYDLLAAGGFNIFKPSGEYGTVRYFHIDVEVIPEPATLSVFGLGFLALFWSVRARKKR